MYGKYICVKCHGECDPGELVNGMCYECRMEEKQQNEADNHKSDNPQTSDRQIGNDVLQS